MQQSRQQPVVDPLVLTAFRVQTQQVEAHRAVLGEGRPLHHHPAPRAVSTQVADHRAGRERRADGRGQLAQGTQSVGGTLEVVSGARRHCIRAGLVHVGGGGALVCGCAGDDRPGLDRPWPYAHVVFELGGRQTIHPTRIPRDGTRAADGRLRKSALSDA